MRLQLNTKNNICSKCKSPLKCSIHPKLCLECMYEREPQQEKKWWKLYKYWVFTEEPRLIKAFNINKRWDDE